MSESKVSPVVNHMHELVLLFEARNSNPNGDPDAGGAPRMRPGTNIGQVTSVCQKRKVRTTMQRMFGLENPRYSKLFYDTDQSLNAKEDAVASRLFGITARTLASQKAKHPEKMDAYVKALCEEYADVRLFGGVLTQALGRVQGPVQVSMAESVDPIDVNHVQITRNAISSDKELLEEGKETMFGEKTIVSYGLFRSHIYITPYYAQKTGMTQEDLDCFFKSVIHMFDNDISDNRPEMRVRALYDFEHLDGDETLRYRTVESVIVMPVPEVKDGTQMAESFYDYAVFVDEENLPETITVRKLL